MAGVERRLVRGAVALDRSGLTLGRAAHNVVGVAAPLVVGVATGHIVEGIAVSGGAMIVGFVDLGGPYSARLRLMLITAALIAVSSFVGFLAGRNDWTAVFVLGAWGFAAGLMAALGPAPSFALLSAALALLLAEDFPTDVPEALRRSAFVLAGGLLQALFAVVVWPFRPNAPEREAAAGAARALSDLTQSWPGPTRSSAFMVAAGKAESMLAAHRTWGARRTAVADRLRRFTDELERTYGELFALRAERAQVSARGGAVLDAGVADTGRALRAIAHALKHRRTPPPVDEPDAIDDGLPAPAARCLHAIRGHVQNLVALATPVGSAATAVPTGLPRSDGPQHGSAPAILRANLNRHSMALRHGVRLGVTLGIAVAIYRLLPLGRGYWVPLTVVFVLKPDFGGTFTRGLQRFAGTLLGVGLASLIAASLAPGDWVEIVLIVVFAFVCYAFFFAQYAIFTVGVTGMIVFFVSLGGFPTYSAVVDRLEDTLIGGALCLGAFLVWPTWEGRADLGARVAALLERDRAFVAAVFAEAVAPGQDRRALEEARAAARLARTNAEATLERALSQPEHRRGDLTVPVGVLYATRSLADAILATDSRLRDEPHREPIPALAPFGDELDVALAAVARALRDDEPPAGIPQLRRTQEAFPEDTPAWIVHDTGEVVESIETMVQLLGGARAGDRPAATTGLRAG